MSMRIGELARTTGESVKTLRFWTEHGLLPAHRGENRYRYYEDGAERLAGTIRRIQALGFTLAEVRDILALRELGLRPCQDVHQRLEQHLRATRRRRAELEQLEQELTARLAWSRSHPDDECDDPDAVCTLLAALA